MVLPADVVSWIVAMAVFDYREQAHSLDMPYSIATHAWRAPLENLNTEIRGTRTHAAFGHSGVRSTTNTCWDFPLYCFAVARRARTGRPEAGAVSLFSVVATGVGASEDSDCSHVCGSAAQQAISFSTSAALRPVVLAPR